MFRAALLIVLIIGCATVGLAQPGADEPLPGYQSKLAYSGIYQADRLYQFNPYEQTWYADKVFKHWDKLRCGTARLALADQGEWQGVLAAAGECAAPGEGQRWATGNYLNFLTGGSPAKVSR